MDIGKIIKALRKEKRVSQEETARVLGVSAQAISKWETGASLPDIALLPAIAAYFGVSIDELFQLPNETQFERIENMFLREYRIPRESFEQAAAFLQGVLADDPQNARACEDLAYLYNRRAESDHRLAAEYARRALALAPEEKGGWVAYLEATGGVCGDEWYDNHFEVIEFFKGFLREHPGHYRGLYAVIENLLADGRGDEAVPYIEDLQAIRDTYQPLVYLGDVALMRGDREGAIRLWNDAVAKSPDAWQAYCCRADRLKKLGFTGQAMADYERCFTMQSAPRLADGLYSIAQLYEGQGDLVSAIDQYERILTCLAEEYDAADGAQAERVRAEIRRLKKLLA